MYLDQFSAKKQTTTKTQYLTKFLRFISLPMLCLVSSQPPLQICFFTATHFTTHCKLVSAFASSITDWRKKHSVHVYFVLNLRSYFRCLQYLVKNFIFDKWSSEMYVNSIARYFLVTKYTLSYISAIPKFNVSGFWMGSNVSFVYNTNDVAQWLKW